MYWDQPFSIYVIYGFQILQISEKLGKMLGKRLNTFTTLRVSASTKL